MSANVLSGSVRGRWLFLVAFSCACLLFWWLPSLLFRVVLHTPDPVRDGTLVVSFGSLCLFATTYLLPVRERSATAIPPALVDATERFAYYATLFGAVPALLCAVVFFHTRSGVDYGSGSGIPPVFQAIFYSHLFLGLLYLGAARLETSEWRPIALICLLTTLPRLIVSFRWGRFFVAQAIVPVVFLFVARGWIRFTPRRIAQLFLLALALIFVPAVTRGDNLSDRTAIVEFFASGSTLRLYQDNTELNLAGRCPPLLVSLTAKIFPYRATGICLIDLWGIKGLPATLDRVLAYNEPGSDVLLVGPGSNFLLELYVTAGLPAVLAGSALFGFLCRSMLAALGTRTLFAGIWAECLTRALLAPRGNLGYVFERVPSLVLVTWFIVLLLWAARLLASAQPEQPVPLQSRCD